MGAHDPTPEFWMLLRQIEVGTVSEDAIPWFDRAFEKVDRINEEILQLKAQGLPAPTEEQALRLARFHRAACKLLGRVPTEEECRAEMLTRTESDSPFTSYPTKTGRARPRLVRRVKHYPKY